MPIVLRAPNLPPEPSTLALALRRRKLPAFQIARAAKLSKASVSRRLCRHADRLAALWPPPPICRSERAHPGDLLPFDLKKLARRGGGVRDRWRLENGRAISCAPAIAPPATGSAIPPAAPAGSSSTSPSTDHSRPACAALLPDETARRSILFLHTALAFCGKLGVKAQRSSSDNGSCYRAHARREAFAALGLKQRRTASS